jgi:hypothetical protein
VTHADPGREGDRRLRAEDVATEDVDEPGARLDVLQKRVDRDVSVPRT